MAGWVSRQLLVRVVKLDGNGFPSFLLTTKKVKLKAPAFLLSFDK